MSHNYGTYGFGICTKTSPITKHFKSLVIGFQPSELSSFTFIFSKAPQRVFWLEKVPRLRLLVHHGIPTCLWDVPPLSNPHKLTINPLKSAFLDIQACCLPSLWIFSVCSVNSTKKTFQWREPLSQWIYLTQTIIIISFGQIASFLWEIYYWMLGQEKLFFNITTTSFCTFSYWRLCKI